MHSLRVETRAERVLGNVLDELRIAHVSTRQLARAWGVPHDWARGRLSGKKGLTGSELGHIADVLGIPVARLEGVDEPAYRHDGHQSCTPEGCVLR